MEEFKKAKVNYEKNGKRKLKMIEIAKVNEKKRTVESCMKSLESWELYLTVIVLSYSTAAEKECDLSFLAKANSFRHTLCKKKELISELDCVLKKLNDEFKNI